MQPLLAVAGFGNMGSAIVRGALAIGNISADALWVSEPDAARARVAQALGCTMVDTAALRNATTLVVAVKPQAWPAVAASIGPLEHDTLVISVMAGISIGSIEVALGAHAHVARVMPNLPAQVGEAMSAIAFGSRCTPHDRAAVSALFDGVGLTATVDESLMNAATAVCGSGPAYVLHLAEHMMRGAMDAGMDETTADLMVRQTIFGAAALLRDSSDPPAVLRAAVTSPHGTTAAALAELERSGVGGAVVRAVIAARDRATELAG